MDSTSTRSRQTLFLCCLSRRNWLQFEVWLQLGSNSLREFLRCHTFTVREYVSVVGQSDVRIPVPHHARHEVDGSASLEQLAGYPVPKTMNTDMYASLRPSDSKLGKQCRAYCGTIIFVDTR